MDIKKIVLLFFLSFSTTFAADCSAVDQVLYDESAVQMMWSIRAWICPNAWWQSITAGPLGGWCNAGGGFTYLGQWTIAGVTSEQECWDITEQIIEQCMYFEFIGDNAIQSDNGGTWKLGSTYAGGWFWTVEGQSCKNTVSTKRDEFSLIDAETAMNYTLSSGETLTVDRQVWLDLTNADDVKVVADVTYN